MRQPVGIGSGWAAGIGAAAVAGLLLGLLAAYFIKQSLAPKDFTPGKLPASFPI